MLITKLATIHGDRLRVRKQVPASGEPVPEPTNLIYVWCDDFGDFLVGLALELTQNENISVMLGKLRYAFLDDLPQVALPVHVIRTLGGVLELQGTVLVLEVFLNR